MNVKVYEISTSSLLNLRIVLVFLFSYVQPEDGHHYGRNTSPLATHHSLAVDTKYSCVYDCFLLTLFTVDTFHFWLWMDENNEHVPVDFWDVCLHDEVVALQGRVM